MFGLMTKKDFKKMVKEQIDREKAIRFELDYPNGKLELDEVDPENWCGLRWFFSIVSCGEIIRKKLDFNVDADIDYAPTKNGYVFINNNTQKALLFDMIVGVVVEIPVIGNID